MTQTTATKTRKGGTGPDLGTGVPIALVSAAAFGLSGSLAASLLVTGWSPAAVVAARIGGAFVVLLIPALLLLRRVGLPTRRAMGRMIVYGVVAVAGGQLCFYHAVKRLSVGVALLLEFLAPVLLIGWLWWRRGHRPTAAKLVGAALSLAGLVLVLDPTSETKISLVGVAWGIAAALCLCAYFLLPDHGSDATPPLAMTAVGTGVGALVLVLAGLVGVAPLAAASAPVTLAARTMPWWVPLATLVLVSAALAYLTGIEAVRRLGSSIASFVALSEVILAVIFAALLLGQIPTPVQAVGGALILAGIAVVQLPPGRPRLLSPRRRGAAALTRR